MALPPSFFSCDWGTTSLRLRLIETVSGRITSEIESANCGVRRVAESFSQNAAAMERAREFQKVLARQISLLPGAGPGVDAAAPVVVSGMASSNIGWKELPYAEVPFAVDGSQARHEWLELTISKQTLPVLLVSGLATETEMMRGEETQLIGLLAQATLAGFAGAALVILPGTHSKHVTVREGKVIGLQTYMTGELFDILRGHSVLRFTTDTDLALFNDEAFLEGVQAAKAKGLMKSLFQARTRGVLGGKPCSSNRSFLSGLLIGAELLESLKDHETCPVALAASGSLARLYQMAAGHLNFSARLQSVCELGEAVAKGHAILLERFCQ